MAFDLTTAIEALHGSAFSVLVREATWIYPFLETVHIIGLALLFGSILSFDLRVLGMGRDLPIGLLADHVLPWVWIGFGMNALSGAAMFASNAVEYAANPALQVKLGLLVVAGINALYFQARLNPQLAGANTSASPSARASAVMSIVVWLSVITAGRMMAYVV